MTFEAILHLLLLEINNTNMAPRAGKAGPARSRGTTGTTSRRRPRPQPEDEAPDAFRDLLSATNNAPDGEGRRIKRRKIAGKTRDEPGAEPESEPELTSVQQTIVDDSDSESDVEFEDVDLGPPIEAAPAKPEEPLHITLESHAQTAKSRRNATRKRRPITAAERAQRLSVHKMHVVFLLYHAFYRNHLCDDAKTQAWLLLSYFRHSHTDAAPPGHTQIPPSTATGYHAPPIHERRSNTEGKAV